MNDDRLLDFVKSRLETDEGISSIGLDRLLTAAKASRPRTWKRPPLGAFLVAASLAVAVCGWFVASESADAYRERNLTEVIDLLCVLDGENSPQAASLPDNLRWWQDAPMQLEDCE